MSARRKSAHQAADPTQTLSIDEIVRDERLQFRELDFGTVRRYASVFRSGLTMPPVKVANLNGALVLTDGWHRVAALESLGQHRVEAVVEPANSLEEAFWFAAKANTGHGLPLKGRKYRDVFRAYIHAKLHHNGHGGFKSYRDIAVELGGAKGFTTIRNWMQSDFPSTFRAMGGHDEQKEWKDDIAPPKVSLAEIVRAALKEAQAGLPAVTEPYERGEIVRMLELLLNEATSVPWFPPEEAAF